MINIDIEFTRDIMRGGGVGFYIKDTLKFKRRKDIEDRIPDLEHVWVELHGKNKNSRLLVLSQRR